MGRKDGIHQRTWNCWRIWMDMLRGWWPRLILGSDTKDIHSSHLLSMGSKESSFRGGLVGIYFRSLFCYIWGVHGEAMAEEVCNGPGGVGRLEVEIRTMSRSPRRRWRPPCLWGTWYDCMKRFFPEDWHDRKERHIGERMVSTPAWREV